MSLFEANDYTWKGRIMRLSSKASFDEADFDNIAAYFIENSGLSARLWALMVLICREDLYVQVGAKKDRTAVVMYIKDGKEAKYAAFMKDIGEAPEQLGSLILEVCEDYPRLARDLKAFKALLEA